VIRASTHQEIGVLCNRTGLVPTPYMKGISLISENRILAVAGYDRWTDNCVEMHIWADFLIPGFVRAAFEYPFIQAGKGLVIGVIAGNNVAALSFTQRLGFEVKYVIKDGNAVGVDLVLQEMRKENCRWIRRLN